MRYFAFLKAINVGGHVVTMERLRRIVDGLGFTDAETFIASGNVTFQAGRRSPRAIERTLAVGLEAALGYAVPTMVRTLPELQAVATHAVFPEAERARAVVINVGFLATPLTAPAARALAAFTTDTDLFHTQGRECYWLSHTRQSESPFFKVKFEKTFGTDVTFRNMNTVRRLLEKYAA